MCPQKQIILIRKLCLSELVRFKSVFVSTELPKSSGRNFFSRILAWSVCVWDLWGTGGRRGCDQTSREGAGSMGVRGHGWLRGGDVGRSPRR